MAKSRNTKRKVDLVSSHPDNEDDGPFLICDDERTGLEMPLLSTSSSEGTYDNLPPHTLPLRIRPGETLTYYEEYIPPQTETMNFDHEQY